MRSTWSLVYTGCRLSSGNGGQNFPRAAKASLAVVQRTGIWKSWSSNWRICGRREHGCVPSQDPQGRRPRSSGLAYLNSADAFGRSTKGAGPLRPPSAQPQQTGPIRTAAGPLDACNLPLKPLAWTMQYMQLPQLAPETLGRARGASLPKTSHRTVNDHCQVDWLFLFFSFFLRGMKQTFIMV